MTLRPLAALALTVAAGCQALGLAPPDGCVIVHCGRDGTVDELLVAVGTVAEFERAQVADPAGLEPDEQYHALVTLLSQSVRGNITFAEHFTAPADGPANRWLAPNFDTDQRRGVSWRQRTGARPEQRAIVVELDADWLAEAPAADVRALFGIPTATGTAVHVVTGTLLEADPVIELIADRSGLRERVD